MDPKLISLAEFEDHQKRISNHRDLQKTKLSDNSTTKVFSIDYSIKSTDKCKNCKLKITKSVLRIGKLVPFVRTTIKQFYHIDCAFNSFKKSKTIIIIPSSMKI